MRPLRMGLACTGWIAGWAVHAPARSSRSVTVTCVASRDARRAERYARLHAVPAHGTWPHLLARSDVDAVYLATPNSDHLSRAYEAVRAGKHVLCEKPLGTDPEAVSGLYAEARRRGVLVQEAYHYRWHPAVAATLARIRGGALGRLTHITVHYGWHLDRSSDIRLRRDLAGGAFLDVGCYGVDLLCSLVSDPWEVTDVRKESGPTGVDLFSEAHLRSGGIAARVRAGLGGPGTVCEAVVEGTGGSVSLTSPFLPVLPGTTPDVRYRASWHGVAPAAAEDAAAPSAALTSYHHQIEGFTRNVRGGDLGAHVPAVERARVLAEVLRRMEHER